MASSLQDIDMIETPLFTIKSRNTADVTHLFTAYLYIADSKIDG